MWLQLLFNEVDALDEDGIESWWSTRLPAASWGNATSAAFDVEVEKFLTWLEEAETDSDEDDEFKKQCDQSLIKVQLQSVYCYYTKP